MNLNYVSTFGTQEEKPSTLDRSSSSAVVYLRKNIVKETQTDETTGNTVTGWRYDECKLTNEEFDQYARESLEEQAQTNESIMSNQEAIMSGLADIFEILLS